MLKENWTTYTGGNTATSHIIGYESSSNRVMRYQFETDDAGASHIHIDLKNIRFYLGNIKQAINWFIGTDADSHKNAGVGSTALGTITFNSDYTAAVVDADILLLPNTTYYLWLFPSVATYSCYRLETADSYNTLIMSGGAGLVYIKNGSEIKRYQAYVKEGLEWKLHLPHKKNSSSWDLLTGG